MTVTASDVIAIVAIVATIVTTSVVAWINHLDRGGDQEHERGLAREQRLQERRGATYRDMLSMVYLVGDVIAQTLPVFERVPAPPRIDGPSPETEREMTATVALYGSAAVVERLEAVSTASRDFFLAAQYLHDLHPDRSVPPPRHVSNELRKVRQDVEAKRTAFSAAKEELERASREELAS